MSRYSRTDQDDPDVIVNEHSRVTHGPLGRAEDLFADLGGANDAIWPSDRWAPMVLDNGHQVGSRGGHGEVRYEVTSSVPRRSVTFTFPPGFELEGSHTLWIEPAPDGRVRWQHTLRLRGPLSAMQRAIVLLHDALLEDLLDQAEAVMARRPVRRRSVLRLLAAKADLVLERTPEPVTLRRSRRPVGLLASGVLGAIGLLHVCWAWGSAFPARDRPSLARAVVGQDSVPGPALCLVAAGALGTASALTAARVRDRVDADPVPFGVVDQAVRAASLVLAARAVAGFAASGLSRGATASYRRLDLACYSPLCAGLALGLWAVSAPAGDPITRRRLRLRRRRGTAGRVDARPD